METSMGDYDVHIHLKWKKNESADMKLPRWNSNTEKDISR